jgi:hypothetical protein
VRNPWADRYAVFQDDILVVKGLREYLSRPMPPKAYLNLVSHSANEHVMGGFGWRQAQFLYDEVQRKRLLADSDSDNRHRANLTFGKGACGLVFDAAGVLALLSHESFVGRHVDRKKGTCNIDGGVVDCMHSLGYTEMVHCPSLLDHRDGVSTKGHPNPGGWKALTFPGELYDVAANHSSTCRSGR